MNQNHSRRKFVMTSLAGAAIAALPGGLAFAADAWPSKTITFVAPFAPGGATDILARIYSQSIAHTLKVPVVVENSPGAGGNIGSAKVARAAPDGYTIVGGTISSHAINVSIYPSIGYDPVKSFEPIILTGTLPNVLVVRAGSPYKTVQDIIAAGKKAGSKLSFGSSGVGTSQHMTAELFKLQTGTDMVHVPYKGSGPALTALLGGEIDMVFDNMISALPFITSGKMVALGVTSEKASPSLPNVKPLAQQGLPGFNVVSWQAVFAPAGTPKPIVDRLYKEMYATLQKPDVQQRLKDMGLEVSGIGGAKMKEFQQAEVAKWAQVAKKANIKLD
jgi:tripartite-type tricarboxylate transporter receptor subunit TctC